MKTKFFITVVIMLLSCGAIAQKKVVPITQSALTGVLLPKDSRQDRRFLTEMSAKILLEMQTNKANTKIKTTEVLYLPPVEVSGFDADSLVNQLTVFGWNIIPLESDDKYVWLQKDGRTVFTYFSMDKKQSDLYFGETENTPNLAGVLNNNAMPQQTDISTQQNQQPTALQQPAEQNTHPVQNSADQNNNNIPASQSTRQNNYPDIAAGSSGIVKATTNFNEGWTGTAEEHFVRLVKGSVKVLLHYSAPLTDEIGRDGEMIRDYFWNQLIVPRYTIQSSTKRPISSLDYPRILFMDAEAIDNANGQSVYIGFRVYSNNDIISCIEITAPTKAAYDEEFSNIAMHDELFNFNKFALSNQDISGTWQETSGSFGQYYNVYSGNYAGMNAVSMSSHFIFDANRSFQQEHKGASGMVGSQQFFKEKSEGSYSLTDWEINIVNKEGKREGFYAYYQAVKGGRILHLENKSFSGEKYSLIIRN